MSSTDSNSELESIGSYNSAEIRPLEKTTTALSRVGTRISQMKVVESLRRTATNAQDDNDQTERNLEEARKTDLGRMLTHTGLADAMRVATHQDPLEAELADVVPGDERFLRKLHKVETEVSEAEVREEEENLPPVDKGYAWVVCFAELLMIITTWGSTTCFGVFISYWLNNDTFPGADPMNYALSSSLTVFLAQALAPVAMIMNNMLGLKVTMMIGVAFHFAGFMLCSYCTELWQLYCTQGLMIGFGFALIFNPAIVILSTWFLKYRSLSSGIVVCGSGVGGVVFALSCQKLIDDQDDFRWAFRMVGIVCVVLNIVVVALVKERIPHPREISWKSFRLQCKTILNIKTMKKWYVLAITFWFAFGIVAYIVLVYSLAAFATFIGLSTTEGAHITAIFNGCQAIGRPFIGMASDKYGKLNVAITLNVVVIILIFAFFINCNNFITLLFFSILSGLITGWCQLINQALMPDVVPLGEFPSVWSYENIIVGSFTLFSEVVALKLRDLSASMPFLKAQLFSGFMVVGSLLFIIPVREYRIRDILQARLELTEEEGEKSDPETAERIQRYTTLLKKDWKTYIARFFYPMKV